MTSIGIWGEGAEVGGMSRGQPSQTPDSPRRWRMMRLGRCRNNGDFAGGVVIDVENSGFDVAEIDTPAMEKDDSFFPGLQTKGKRVFPDAVINLEDDEYGEGESSDGDYILVFDEPTTELRPECPSSSNRYGLGSGRCSEGDSSSEEEYPESDSDCEIVEDPSGCIREQWERAAAKRRSSAEKLTRAHGDCGNASSSGDDVDFRSSKSPRGMLGPENHANMDRHNEAGGMPGQCDWSCCGVGFGLNGRREASRQVPMPRTCDTAVNGSWPPNVSVTASRPPASCPSQSWESFCPFRHTSTYEAAPSNAVPVSHGGAVFWDQKDQPEVTPCYVNLSFTGDDVFQQHGLDEIGNETGCQTFDFRYSTEFNANGSHSSCHVEVDQVLPKDSIINGMGKHVEEHSHSTRCAEAGPETAATQEENFYVDASSSGTLAGNFQELNVTTSDVEDYNLLVTLDILLNEHEKSLDLFDECEKTVDELIGGHEKHKKSTEYKNATEQEWASRKRKLDIQSEEAMRLCKKKKAETLRLLDMERRQKQRLEEIRESELMEKETTDLKEKYRSEVKTELDEMEIRYRDMASLLRVLGIPVPGGPFPLSSEVNAAYKKALLRFHPDRVSRMDIRQQVEAEEKFKLISRVKERMRPLVY